MKDEYKTTGSPYHQCSKEDIGACDKCHEAVSKPKEAGGKRELKPDCEHYFGHPVIDPITSYCRKCGGEMTTPSQIPRTHDGCEFKTGYICHPCGVKHGKRKLEGVHTAMRNTCEICGEEDIILPKRHYGL